MTSCMGRDNSNDAAEETCPPTLLRAVPDQEPDGSTAPAKPMNLAA